MTASAAAAESLAPPLLLPDLLRYRAETTPDRPAYLFHGSADGERERLTDAALHRLVRGLAGRLQSLAEVCDRVLLLHRPGLGFVVAFLACLSAGMVAVPLPPPRRNRPLDRLAAVAADAGSRLPWPETR